MTAPALSDLARLSPCRTRFTIGPRDAGPIRWSATLPIHDAPGWAAFYRKLERVSVRAEGRARYGRVAEAIEAVIAEAARPAEPLTQVQVDLPL